MFTKPKCIVITGRPGSGKSTLAEKLSRELCMPKISRDEIKEGYVNTFGVKHNELPEDTNYIVNEIFFKTITDLLNSKVSIVIEAAFQHKIWELIMPEIIKLSTAVIIICKVPPELSAKRHLERGLNNPKREYFHGDKRVSHYKNTGQSLPPAPYTPPIFDIPTLQVSTENSYKPGFDEIVKFICSLP